MVVKQVGKIILGADLNEKEKKALDIEIGKEFAKYNRNNTNEVDGTTFKAYAPIVDCVKVTTEAVLIWDENHNEPAMGNYQK